MQPVQEELKNPYSQSEYDRERRAEETFWNVIGRLYRWRKFIIGVSVFVAVSSVVISLLLPNWYKGQARVLVPESSGGFAAGLLSNLPSAASTLLGGGVGGNYTRYLAILTSRSMLETAVDSFNLVQVYELGDSETPRSDAIDALEDNVQFEIDDEYDFLSIAVLDKDPERAASLANFFVRRLNSRNMELASSSAANYRTYVEERYYEARSDMDSVLMARQSFQEEYGVFDLPTQTQSFFEQIARLRASVIEAEIQHEALRAQYGEENQQTRAFREIAEAANRKYRNALSGGERILPVPQETAPTVGREFAHLEMERMIQTAILEILGPMYEQARLQEEREYEAVQVVDAAIPPNKKAKPKRSVIVVAATLSAFLLAIVFVLLYEWWRRNHGEFAHRLQEAATASASGSRQ